MKLLVFIGSSGSGKSTLVRELQSQRVIEVTPSWTTRPRRDDEGLDTPEHRFVSEVEFDVLERKGFFLEVVRMFGLPFRYGLPPVRPPEKGIVPAIMVRAPLIELVAKHYPSHVVYQIEVERELASTRVRARHADDSTIGTRIDGHDEECALGRRLSDRIFDANTSLELVAAVRRAVLEDFRTEGSSRS